MSKEKLSRVRSPWHRLLLSALLLFLIFFGSFKTSSRARIHWLGHRRRRPERALFSTIMISSIAFFELGEYMIWAVIWGGMLSIFVTLNSIYILIPRKRAHWVKQL